MYTEKELEILKPKFITAAMIATFDHPDIRRWLNEQCLASTPEEGIGEGVYVRWWKYLSEFRLSRYVAHAHGGELVASVALPFLDSVGLVPREYTATHTLMGQISDALGTAPEWMHVLPDRRFIVWKGSGTPYTICTTGNNTYRIIGTSVGDIFESALLSWLFLKTERAFRARDLLCNCFQKVVESEEARHSKEYEFAVAVNDDGVVCNAKYVILRKGRTSAVLYPREACGSWKVRMRTMGILTLDTAKVVDWGNVFNVVKVLWRELYARKYLIQEQLLVHYHHRDTDGCSFLISAIEGEYPPGGIPIGM